ncbi:MAG: hypothetical protein NVS9B4_07400 [Candidatus Acidiferrum sp.]
MTAIGKNGEFVTNLKAEDFSIVEAKIPAKVRHVECGKPEPLLIGLLVDMGAGRRADPLLKSQYDALEGFLFSTLGPGDGAFIGVFNGKLYALSKLTADHLELASALDQIREQGPWGPTALYDAIKLFATANINGLKGHRIIVAVGDFEDNASVTKLDDSLLAAQTTSTTIFSIVASKDFLTKHKKEMKRGLAPALKLSEGTGGEAFSVAGKKEFEDSLHAISTALNGYCRVQYEPAGIAIHNGARPLRVKSNRHDVVLLGPETRYAATQ